MSFATLNFSGTASGTGYFGQGSTTGTFAASITGNADGSISGTWSFNGTYVVTGFYGTSGTHSMSGTLAGTGGLNGPWAVSFSGGSATLTYSAGQYALNMNAGYHIEWTVNLGYDGNYTYEADMALQSSLALAGAAPFDSSGPTNGPDTVTGTAAPDNLDALGGNDTVNSAEGNDRVTGGAGNDAINGGAGIDTAVFGDARASYTVAAVQGGWTVTHNTLVGDGTDTLVDVERLQFSDAKVAVDLNGNAGQAYRLYKAAFDRVPDVPGLGFQMNALDTGHTLLQVAANFIASPEFQATYGAVDDTQFVTLLYQNVLDREPEAEGLAFHLNRLATGTVRADILVGFSESPENKANVIGQIEAGMVYIFP